MDKETTKMIPGDELHLTMLMAPYSLNLVTGQDRQHLLAFGRAAFDAGKADRPAQCLHQIAEPDTQEPFMWAIQEPGGGAYMDEGCVSSVREDVQAEVDGLNSGLDADDDPYRVVPVYLAAAPQAVQAAVPEGWKLAPIKVPDSAFAWVSGGYPAGFKAGDKRDTAVVHERAQRTWEAILNGITAPAHPAEGVQAQTMQASEGIEDVAVMEHPEWMLVHKETGAQKPLDSQWTVRATQPATQGMEAHEFVLGVAGLLPDPRDGEFFRWLTGDHESAETRIACASLIGRMSVMSTSAVRADIANAIAAQAKQGGASNDAT